MKFNILDLNFKRIADSITGAGYAENWESEYYEDPIDPTFDYTERAINDDASEETLVNSAESLTKLEVVLVALGNDTSNMSLADLDKILIDNPGYADIVPVFNVNGSWAHALRTSDINDLKDTIISFMSATKEVCVTDESTGVDFTSISEYRNFVLILEGTVKVLFNADVYSSASKDSPGELGSSIGQDLDYINKITEGWLVPSESSLVGIRVSDDFFDFRDNVSRVENVQVLEDISKELNVPIFKSGEIYRTDKVLESLEVISLEESMNYVSCDIDESSPEYLHEPVSEGDPYNTYYDKLAEDLQNSAYFGDIEGLTRILNQGIDVNINNGATLAIATGGESTEAVELLLQNGADPNINNGRALANAVYASNEDIVKILLLAGASVDVTNPYDGLNILYTAIEGGDAGIVKLLVQYGADINMDNGKPLNRALLSTYPDIFKYLVEAGADIRLIDPANIEKARDEGQPELANYASSLLRGN